MYVRLISHHFLFSQFHPFNFLCATKLKFTIVRWNQWEDKFRENFFTVGLIYVSLGNRYSRIIRKWNSAPFQFGLFNNFTKSLLHTVIWYSGRRFPVENGIHINVTLNKLIVNLPKTQKFYKICGNGKRWSESQKCRFKLLVTTCTCSHMN